MKGRHVSESNGRSAIRNYVVLEEQRDDTGTFYVLVLTVPARNATNALRAAFRELARRAEGKDDHEAVLVVVPESMWRPTPVRARVHSRVSVSVG